MDKRTKLDNNDEAYNLAKTYPNRVDKRIHLNYDTKASGKVQCPLALTLPITVFIISGRNDKTKNDKREQNSNMNIRFFFQTTIFLSMIIYHDRLNRFASRTEISGEET